MTNRGHARAAGWAISSPHALSTRAGVDAFERGGNAIDAALAAAASLTVTLPDNCALGGDLIALVRAPSGDVTVVNASGPAAARVPVEDLRRQHGSVMPPTGPHTVTVPGVIAGWESLWAQGARLPWRDAFSRAMHQAADGVPVARSVADALALERNDLVADAGMRALFFPDGEPLAYGARLVQPRLAESLEQIAAGGANAFYRGDVGDRFRATLERLGSALSADDFAAYEPELTQPLRAEHGTAEVLTAPPNSQGAMLLMILAAAPDADGLTRQAPALAAAFSASIDARSRRLADPRFDDGGADPPRVVEQRADRGDTVAIVSADADGRAVSLIQSVFHSFGAGILDPSTGIVAHNRGSFFSLDPASPNVLAGGKRPAHTLTPVLVCEGGELSVVLGTRGGRAQPQILAQILQRLWLGSDAAAALAAPRWIVGDGESELLVEGRVPAEAADALTAAGWSTTPLADFDMTAGQSQLIVRAADGAYSAATDPRCEGLARTG